MWAGNEWLKRESLKVTWTDGFTHSGFMAELEGSILDDLGRLSLGVEAEPVGSWTVVTALSRRSVRISTSIALT